MTLCIVKKDQLNECLVPLPPNTVTQWNMLRVQGPLQDVLSILMSNALFYKTAYSLIISSPLQSLGTEVKAFG